MPLSTYEEVLEEFFNTRPALARIVDEHVKALEEKLEIKDKALQAAIAGQETLQRALAEKEK